MSLFIWALPWAGPSLLKPKGRIGKRESKDSTYFEEFRLYALN